MLFCFPPLAETLHDRAQVDFSPHFLPSVPFPENNFGISVSGQRPYICKEPRESGIEQLNGQFRLNTTRGKKEREAVGKEERLEKYPAMKRRPG